MTGTKNASPLPTVVLQSIAVPLKHPGGGAMFSDVPLHIPRGHAVMESVTKRLKDFPRGGLGLHGFRSAPLLTIFGSAGAQLVITGQWRFFLLGRSIHQKLGYKRRWYGSRSRGTEYRLEVEAHISGVWSESDGWASVASAETEEDLPQQVGVALGAGCFKTEHPSPGDDAQSVVTTLAKASSESSRDAVQGLRVLRYHLESELASKIRTEDADSGTLASVVALRTAVGMARDEAMRSARDNLSMLHDDPEAYHRYRLAMDPTLLLNYRPADVSTRSWMRLHDAAIRQCRAMDEQLREESLNLAQLLDAATTIYTARDAKAQETLNTVGVAAAAVIGVPSLVLAYYGADGVLPSNAAWPLPAFLTVVVPISLICLYGIFRLATKQPMTKAQNLVVLFSLFILSLLFVVVMTT